MANIGSVFLGDSKRIRVLSGSMSTPPSSPPPTSMSGVFTGLPSLPVIDPVLSLELRLRWVEAILLGVKPDARDKKGKESEKLASAETLSRAAEDIQRRLDTVIEGNDSLKRFMEHCKPFIFLPIR